jgi:hypothetical protein
MNRPCAAEVDGAKLKCVYWITQHKDGSKRKNRVTLKTVGMGHGASFDLSTNSGQAGSGQVGYRVRSQGAGGRDQPPRLIASARQGGRSVKSTHFLGTPQNPLQDHPPGEGDLW